MATSQGKEIECNLQGNRVREPNLRWAAGSGGSESSGSLAMTGGNESVGVRRVRIPIGGRPAFGIQPFFFFSSKVFSNTSRTALSFGRFNLRLLRMMSCRFATRRGLSSKYTQLARDLNDSKDLT